MASDSRRLMCVHSKNSFCYICGEFRASGNMRSLTENVRLLYAAYFGKPIRERAWTPEVACAVCLVGLTAWAKEKRTQMPLGVPMVWSEPRNHEEDCYFCLTDVRGLNKHNRKTWKYPVLQSAYRPKPHSRDVPGPMYRDSEPERAAVSPVRSSSNSLPDSDEFYRPEDFPEKFDQSELNDLVRDLHLSKESAELLASRLKEKNSLTTGTLSKRIQSK